MKIYNAADAPGKTPRDQLCIVIFFPRGRSQMNGERHAQIHIDPAISVSNVENRVRYRSAGSEKVAALLRTARFEFHLNSVSVSRGGNLAMTSFEPGVPGTGSTAAASLYPQERARAQVYASLCTMGGTRREPERIAERRILRREDSGREDRERAAVSLRRQREEERSHRGERDEASESALVVRLFGAPWLGSDRAGPP